MWMSVISAAVAGATSSASALTNKAVNDQPGIRRSARVRRNARLVMTTSQDLTSITIYEQGFHSRSVDNLRHVHHRLDCASRSIRREASADPNSMARWYQVRA